MRQVAAAPLQTLKPLALRLRALPHLLALEFGVQIFECRLVLLDVGLVDLRTVGRLTCRTFEWGILRRGPPGCLPALDFFGPVATVPAAGPGAFELAALRQRANHVYGDPESLRDFADRQ